MLPECSGPCFFVRERLSAPCEGWLFEFLWGFAWLPGFFERWCFLLALDVWPLWCLAAEGDLDPDADFDLEPDAEGD